MTHPAKATHAGWDLGTCINDNGTKIVLIVTDYLDTLCTTTNTDCCCSCHQGRRRGRRSMHIGSMRSVKRASQAASSRCMPHLMAPTLAVKVAPQSKKR